MEIAMSTKITVLVDNIGKDDLKGEWGLSIMVEYDGKFILADAGSSELFAKNAEKLGFDLNKVEFATLSHAHFDHSNGMPRFFKENQNAKFYLRAGAEENCYFKKLFVTKYIGLPRGIIEDKQDRIEFVQGNYKVCDGVYLIPNKCDGLEKVGRKENLYIKTSKGYRPDNFAHEQSLVLETSKGLVIINCCSHGGAANIIDQVQSVFPDKHIYGLIGGFHLFRRSNKEVRKIGQNILDTGIDFVCTGHCTKDRAYGVLKEVLQDRLEQLSVGKVMEF